LDRQILEIHPKDVLGPLRIEWEAKFESIASRQENPRDDNAEAEPSHIHPAQQSKHSRVEEESDKENAQNGSRKRRNVDSGGFGLPKSQRIARRNALLSAAADESEDEFIEFMREMYKRKPKASKEKWYGINGGGKPGVYTDYAEVAKIIKLHKGRQQRFPSREEAQAFVDRHKPW
jgi:hypothetical protein